MPNAYTTPSDVFKPQAIGQALKGYLYNNLALLASGYVGDIPNAIWSKGGKQVTFPKVMGIVANGADGKGSSQNKMDGTKVDSKKFSITSVTADAVERILSIAVDKYTLEYAYTDPDLYSAIIQQVGEQVSDEIDKAIVTTAEASTLVVTKTAAITYDAVVEGLGQWGDKMARADAMLVVHSKVYQDILKIADFKDAAKFGAPTQITGQVPFLAGLPVFVSDNITTVTGTPNTYRNLIVRRGAVRLGMRSDVAMEIKTEPGNTMRYLDFDWAYVPDLASTAQTGVVKLITQ